MDHYQIIAARFQRTMETIAMSVDQVAESIAQGGELMSQVLLQDGKLFSCGNGPDAAICQLFTAYLVSRLEQERPSLPAFNLSADGAALTGIMSQASPTEIFSRPLRALAQEGDLLLVLHSAGEQDSLAAAVDTAHESGMLVVVICHEQSSDLAGRLRAGDAQIVLSAASVPARIEMQTMIVHSLCQFIESNLFGHYDEE